MSDDHFALANFFRPGGIPARNHKGERLLLYLGIIDILQSFRMRKKLEHAFKAVILDGVRETMLYCNMYLPSEILPASERPRLCFEDV